MRENLVRLNLRQRPATQGIGPVNSSLPAAQASVFEPAVRERNLLAHQGDTSAQSHVGMMYAYGEGVPQDYAEAIRWFCLAADSAFDVS